MRAWGSRGTSLSPCSARSVRHTLLQSLRQPHRYLINRQSSAVKRCFQVGTGVLHILLMEDTVCGRSWMKAVLCMNDSASHKCQNKDGAKSYERSTPLMILLG